MKFSHFVALFVVSALLGCTDTGQGPLDRKINPPFLSRLSVTPDSVNIDTLSPTSGSYTVTSGLSALIFDPDGTDDVQKVSFRILRGSSLLQSGQLTRSQIVNLGITFTGTVSFSVQRSETGSYWIEAEATDKAGSTSNTVRQQLVVTKQNTPPFILSIGVPFTNVGPAVRLEPNVTVSDSNGYSDISSVLIRFRNSSDSSWHAMTDDGFSGDARAGDGVYFASLTVTPLAGTENMICEVRATDRSGATGTATRAVANRAPVIVSLNVPGTITRPNTGAQNFLFQLRATDPDGYSDIDSVYFRNLSSSSPTNILMYDDGNIAAWGDSVAGDGVFSRVVTIDAATSAGDRTFLFRVTDRSKAKTDSTRVITIN